MGGWEEREDRVVRLLGSCLETSKNDWKQRFQLDETRYVSLSRYFLPRRGRKPAFWRYMSRLTRI